MIELLGFIATAIAIAGVILNNYRMRWCFGLWLVSNAISLSIHWHMGIVSLTIRDAVFLILAVHGLVMWSR